VPRDDGNQIYNVLEFTLAFNNLFPNIRKRITSKTSEGKEKK
jgi:hypothetical protein